VSRLPTACVHLQAEAIARKNDLSFIDLLRPFANVDTSNVAINTTREQVRACALACVRALAGARARWRRRGAPHTSDTWRGDARPARQPYRVPRMTLQFCESGEVAQPPEEFIDIVLDGVVRASATNARSMVSTIDSKETAAAVMEMKDEKDLAPWFAEYRTELLRGLRWTDHEYFDHPVAVLLIASASEGDVVNKLMSLLSLDRFRV
jgi:hypothetical protein